MSGYTTESTMPDGRPIEAQPKWRQDFPVDVARDQSISRRDFAKFMVLTSGAFAVGQVWIGLRNTMRQWRGADPRITIAALDDVPIGGAMGFHYPGKHDPCILIRPDADTLLAYDQRCTHLACAVIPRVEQGHIHCPCHEGYFDLRTGVPTAGPPQRPLPRIILEVHDGLIYATGVERRV